MRIVVGGAKASGKTTVGTALADRLGIAFLDCDDVILARAARDGTVAATRAELYRFIGREAFRALEREAVAEVAQRGACVLATGGSTLLDPWSRRQLRPAAIWVYLSVPVELLWERITRKEDGLPAYLEGSPDPRAAFAERAATIDEVMRPRCDVLIEAGRRDAAELVDELVVRLSEELAVQAVAPNTLGTVVRLTTFGESHGPMLGAVLDGVQPGLPLTAADVQRDLDRRRPGQSSVSTARREADRVEIVSGVFEGRTTGTSIGLLIRNADSRSAHYEAIKDAFRPGHADYTFWQKYGLRDYRGGGRSSGRETVARVAGGAVARQALAQRGVTIRAHTLQVGAVRAETIDYDEIERNPVRCGDKGAAVAMETLILEAKQRGDSVGGIAQLDVAGLPAGLGDPVFAKLDARLAGGLFSLGAVKGVEFGSGFAVATTTGSQNNDQMADGTFLSNHAGGVLGGISTGQPLVVRVAIKPTPSVARAQRTLDIEGRNRTISIEGRHDPCIVPRIVPVIEAMAALILLDAWEIQDRLRPDWLEQARKSAPASTHKPTT